MLNTAPERWVHVAAGVVQNAEGKVLIALRPSHVHQGGLWEFPGGKLEPGETPEQALIRELKEELDVNVHSAELLMTIRHRYPDKNIQLYVFLVRQFSGVAKSLEGQAFVWEAVEQLPDYAFPKANRGIVNALRLPDSYAIVDDGDGLALMDKLEKILARGVKLIQARLKQTPTEQTQEFLNQAYPLCQQFQARLLLNSAVSRTAPLNADGLHLTTRDLMALTRRPPGIHWLAASCHNLEECRHAQHIGVDFIVLAPVLPTPTHPEQPGMGWRQFADWVAETSVPVYALGGMTAAHLTQARQAGAQGIAGISTFL